MSFEDHFNWTQTFPDDAGKLGEYLKKSGQPLYCRLDVRITSTEELKKAAVLISELNKALNHYAYSDQRDPVLRVLMARDAMQQARIQLKYLRPKKVAKEHATRSVRQTSTVWDLDRARRGPDVSE